MLGTLASDNRLCRIGFNMHIIGANHDLANQIRKFLYYSSQFMSVIAAPIRATWNTRGLYQPAVFRP